MSPQAQGSEGTLLISEELTFNTIPEVIVEDCEDAWDESAAAGITASLDGADFKVGAGSAKFVEDGTSGIEVLATEVVVAADWSDYTHVVAWVKCSIALAAGDFRILLDDTADCASPIELLDIPALVADTWTQVKIAIAVPASLDTTIVSVGIDQTVDKGALTFRIDNIRVVKQAHQVFFNSESLKRTNSLNNSNAITGSRNPKAPTRGAGDVAGDITAEVNPFIGMLFKHLFGGYAVSAGPPYTHTFTIGSLPIGLNTEKGFTDIDQYFNMGGCKVNSFSSAMNPDGVVEATFGVLGASQTVRTYTIDPDPITNSHIPFEGLEASIVEGVVTLAIGTVVDFEMNNNCDGGVYVIGGGGDRYSIPSGIVSVSGTVTVLFENMTLYNKAINFTESALKLTWTRGDGLGSAGNEKLELYMDEVKYSEDTPAIDGPTGVLVNLPFTAYYDDDAQASAIYAKLYNATPSYLTY